MHGLLVTGLDSRTFEVENAQVVLGSRETRYRRTCVPLGGLRRVLGAVFEDEADIKDGVAQLKIRKLAPDYVKKLRADQQVEIADPDLKAMYDQFEVQAAAAAAAAQAEQPANGSGACRWTTISRRR